MADKLFDATAALARKLGGVKSWFATGSTSTASLSDTTRNEVDDYWNEGTLWITEDAGGAGAAPEGEFFIIDDFTQTPGTFVFSAAATVQPATNDRYMVANATYPLPVMIDAINTVLQGVYIPVWNSTALDTAAAQTEYSLPSPIRRGDLLEVLWQTQTGDSNDNRWQKINNWRVKEAGTGTQDTLIIPQMTASRDIALVYRARHPLVLHSTTSINEIVDLDALATHAAINCMLYRMEEGDDNKYLSAKTNMFYEMAEYMPVQKYPLKKASTFNIMSQPEKSAYTGEVGSVRLGG